MLGESENVRETLKSEHVVEIWKCWEHLKMSVKSEHVRGL